MKNELSYKINEEKRTIICIGEDCEYDLIKDLFKRISSESNDIKACFSAIYAIPEFDLGEALILSEQYKGKAVCSPFDTWDVEKGKAIARKKMRINYNNAKYKKLIKACNLFGACSDVLFDMCNYSESILNNTCSYLANEIGD